MRRSAHFHFNETDERKTRDRDVDGTAMMVRMCVSVYGDSRHIFASCFSAWGFYFIRLI